MFFLLSTPDLLVSSRAFLPESDILSELGSGAQLCPHEVMIAIGPRPVSAPQP